MKTLSPQAQGRMAGFPSATKGLLGDALYHAALHDCETCMDLLERIIKALWWRKERIRELEAQMDETTNAAPDAYPVPFWLCETKLSSCDCFATDIEKRVQPVAECARFSNGQVVVKWSQSEDLQIHPTTESLLRAYGDVYEIRYNLRRGGTSD